jgi:hypothetical protein
MKYVLHGRLFAYVCDDCDEPLAGTVVRLHRTADEKLVGRVAADPKDTLYLVSDEESRAREATLLAEAVIGEDGSFQVELPEGYDGGPFDVDLSVAPASDTKPGPDRPTPVAMHVTTLQPRWKRTESGAVAIFEHFLPSRIWCAVRARLGIWTICGTVTVCDTKQAVAGVTVKAFDADWIQDDALGAGLTDSDGHFRIDYTRPSFEITPFSPGLNVETFGGPDLYFRVEAPGGAVLLVEPRSKARTPGRENVGPCKCVKLCLTGEVPTNIIPTIPMFTKVGSYRVKPTFGDFASDGTTTAGNLAFTGDIPLVGVMPEALSPDSIEYRFTVQNLGGGGANPVDATQMKPTEIGTLQYLGWDGVGAWEPGWSPFWANNPGATASIPQADGTVRTVTVNTDIGADGWIKAPRTDSLVPGGDGRFVPNGTLAELNTEAYTLESFDLIAAPSLEAGQSVPAAFRSTKPTFRIVFQARQVVGGAAVGSNTLAKIAFSNVTYSYVRHAYWAGGPVTTTGVASLGIQEMVANGGCADLEHSLHALYTAYHPYMGQPSITFEGNPILPAPILPPVVGDQAVSPAGGELVDIDLLAKCAYILWLSVPLRLTSGSGPVDLSPHDRIAFCKKV